MSSPRKGSQFEGAAAMFQQKEKEVLDRKGIVPGISPRPPMKKFGNASMGNFDYSPKRDSRKASLQAPPFVSPGVFGRTNWNRSASQYPTSSYLDKASGTPIQTSRKKVGGVGFDGLSFSPSPDGTGKPKVTTKSWKDKHSISFQATSPGTLKKKTVKPAFNQHFGGSYLDPKPNKSRASEKVSDSVVQTLPETPDIKIQVKIPDIDKKIRARRAAQKYVLLKEKEQNVPEWKLKVQQREANRIRKESEVQFKASSLIQAFAFGWMAQQKLPKLLEENAERLQKMRERERLQQLKIDSAIAIQKSWRGFLPRKRYLYVKECRRRRQRNEKEIKQIEKAISNMPKQTKSAIKDMKKELSEKKKALKKELKTMMKEDEKKLDTIKKSGRDMIEYSKGENKKLKEKQEAMKAEYKLLEKQFYLLTQKSDEIARDFTSLQGFVDKKNGSIQKHEINSQKCRHRYLPKYRAMIKDRDKHCIAEYRIGRLYKDRLESIVHLLVERSSNQSFVQEAENDLATCESELEIMLDIPVPEGLQHRL